MAEPDEYHKSTTLKLHFNAKDPQDCSLDEAGAQKLKGDKGKANTHGTWVQQLQQDLVALGYLPAKDNKGVDMADGHYGRSTDRAIRRFQRHAARVYRMDAAKKAQDVKPADAFTGAETGVCDPATATEIRKWIGKGWVNPVGRFKLTDVNHGAKGVDRLREDAVAAWDAICDAVAAKGGDLGAPYGNTFRRLSEGGGAKGSSKYSFHHCGRAVDINQANKIVVKDPQGGRMFWRVFQKTAKQDGTQGTKLAKGAVKRYDHKSNTESDIAEGHYLELTVEITSGGLFERIPAQSSWEDRKAYDDAKKAFEAAGPAEKDAAKKAMDSAYVSLYNKQEWWHFQWVADKQKTFIDELELIGFTEPEVRKIKDKDGNLKWPNDADLDHAPG